MDRIGTGKDPGESYVSWAKELQEELEDNLALLEIRVGNWGGYKE